ncbi:WD40-repeat-containing domain protein [Mycotypha africana]|uniref:WD40-repeat-containing domain protein n=1 Tax=Mycotypha africana TaxID=64632 RepID=UPI00230198AF|nr:WD40-repeat-containing domain protein [Mycotypha africana]KAI8991336.1 WD40-repeat-containing domain protein [Mycotypha africana]
MSVYNHRPMGGAPPTASRLLELLDAIKSEYDQLAQEVIVCKNQRDEYEHKMNSQIQEMKIFQQNLMDLERTQQMIKKQYEEEIARLRSQLEQHQHGAGGPPPPSSAPVSNGYNGPSGYQQPQQPQQGPPPPSLMESKPSVSQHHSSYPPSNTGHAAPPTNGPPHPSVSNGPPQQPQPPQSAHSAASGTPYMNDGSPLPSNAPPPPSSQLPSKSGAGGPLPPTSVPPPPPSSTQQQQQLSQPSEALGDINPESVPANMKVEGQDWFALFNPKATRYLKVDLLHTFDHGSVVCCVKFSSDGRYLAAGCNQATYIYDTVTATRVAILQDTSAGRDGDLYIRSVSFSPDGKYLATGAEDKQIRIWDIAKKRIRGILSGHEQDIYSLEFSRDGRILVSGSGDRTARIWDWQNIRCLHELRINDVEQQDLGVTSVAISPDSRLVAAGSLDKVVRVWDAVTGQLLERLEGHKDSVYSVAFMPDGKTLVSGSLDKTLRMWQLGTNERNAYGSERKSPCIQVFTGHKDFVLSVATTPDGHWIVSGSKDRGVQFWDPRTGQTQFMLQGHKNSVISVATSPGHRPMFATGSGDNRARIWSYEPLGP